MEWGVSETTDIITNKKYPLPTVRMSQQKPPRKINNTTTIVKHLI
jgi:hypothetical protein